MDRLGKSNRYLACNFRTYPSRGHIFIYMFHMPFFFMLSGFLYKKSGFAIEIKKTFKTLILPYITYNALLIVGAIICGEFKIGILYHILLGNQEGIGIKYFNPLWFIVSLFVMRIFSSFINEKKLIYVGIISIIIAITFYNYGCFSYDNDYFQFATTIICFPFFTFGNLIKNNKSMICLPKQNKLFYLIIILVVILILEGIGYFNGNVNIFRATNAGDSIVIFYVVGFLLSYLIIVLISYFFNKYNSVVTTISKGTILILCTHQFFIVQINNLFPLNTITSVILSFVILSISYGLIKLSYKYCPILIGK